MEAIDSINMEMVEKVGVIGICLVLSYMMVKHIWGFLKIEKEAITVLVTAAAGEIGYSLVPEIAQGAMLGKDQPLILHLLDTEVASKALKAVQMELLDSAYPLLQGVVATTNVNEAWKGVDIGIILVDFPPLGIESLIYNDAVDTKNTQVCKAYGFALNKHAAEDCKVVVAANKANTIALILKEFAPSIEAKNITCLTRLDHNRALGQISEKLGVPVSSVKNVIVWGNNENLTQYPDANHAVVSTNDGQRRVLEVLASDSDRQWLNEDLIDAVQHRGDAVFEARKMKQSAFSTSKAICDHVHDWIHATPKGTWVSMGVWSDGSYGIEPERFYSFPVSCHNGQWSIIQGLKINEFSRRRMDETMKEVAQERNLNVPRVCPLPYIPRT
ncbi:hypothetical protein V2J09_013924 [Rumex salicifolius]